MCLLIAASEQLSLIVFRDPPLTQNVLCCLDLVLQEIKFSTDIAFCNESFFGNNFVVPKFYIFLFIISFNGRCNSIKYGNAERMNSISLDISFEDWELLPALDVIFNNHSLLFFSLFLDHRLCVKSKMAFE